MNLRLEAHSMAGRDPICSREVSLATVASPVPPEWKHHRAIITVLLQLCRLPTPCGSSSVDFGALNGIDHASIEQTLPYIEHTG